MLTEPSLTRVPLEGMLVVGLGERSLFGHVCARQQKKGETIEHKLLPNPKN